MENSKTSSATHEHHTKKQLKETKQNDDKTNKNGYNYHQRLKIKVQKRDKMFVDYFTETSVDIKDFIGRMKKTAEEKGVKITSIFNGHFVSIEPQEEVKTVVERYSTRVAALNDVRLSA